MAWYFACLVSLCLHMAQFKPRYIEGWETTERAIIDRVRGEGGGIWCLGCRSPCSLSPCDGCYPQTQPPLELFQHSFSWFPKLYS